MSYKVGDMVVYPRHGAAKVEAITERTVKGVTREYLQLSVLSSDGLVINVPVDNAKKVGVRDIVSASEVAKVFDILRTPIIEKEMNWSRRYKLNVEKIATGDVNSVKLYFYNYDETVGVTTGKEVPRNMYRILEADKNGWLHMEIPNMAAMILVYDCNVKDGSAAASYQVSNTVTLSNGSKSSDSGITYQVKADATATTAQFVLRKKDSYSGVSLEGAVFTISQYDTVSGQFVPWTGTGTLTTDKNGQASLAVLDSKTASCLHPDVLYKLVETKAPQNYQLDATPHYLLFRKSASAESLPMYGFFVS